MDLAAWPTAGKEEKKAKKPGAPTLESRIDVAEKALLKRKGRTCTNPGCGTKLALSNPNDLCWSCNQRTNRI